MSLKRLAITVFLTGSALKAVLIIIWKLSTVPMLGLLLTKYDPAAFYLAERTTPVFFDQKRLFPAAGEGMFFEVVLVIAFGIECLVIGCAVWGVLRWRPQARGTAGAAPPVR